MRTKVCSARCFTLGASIRQTRLSPADTRFNVPCSSVGSLLPRTPVGAVTRRADDQREDR